MNFENLAMLLLCIKLKRERGGRGKRRKKKRRTEKITM